MKKTILAFLFTGIFAVQFLMADSPITSTPFWEVFKSEKIIRTTVHTSGLLTPELADFLISDKNEISIKMAVINCLSWDINGKTNSEYFLNYLIDKKIYLNKKEFKSKGDADHLLCMAYLKAMDDYFELKEALVWANLAIKKNSTSYTFAIIHGLIAAQAEFGDDWCKVYMYTHKVRINDNLKKDMREDAIEIIFEYMDMYESSCQ